MQQYSRRLFVIALLILWGAAPAFARSSALLELVENGSQYQGRLAAKDQQLCWLMGRDGRLHCVKLNEVEAFKTIANRFRRLSAAELRDQLRREFKGDLEIVGTQHYLICAERKKAKDYANIFEDIYRTFHVYFSTRGFKMTEPEFPLVAIVFPDREQFVSYCRSDGIQAPAGIRGYYLRTSNRVALYDPGVEESAAHPLPVRASRLFAKRGGGSGRSTGAAPLGWHAAEQSLGRTMIAANIQAGLKDTIIHETTHQVAFNTGLHSRIGANPKWVVEGLATVFEAPGIRDSSPRLKADTRLNRDRFVWFQNYVQSRRPQKSLTDFIARDDLFQTGSLDAYSQAWALSFYLLETRPAKYARYLKNIAQRDVLAQYPEEERIDDFKEAFGNDVNWLETDFLRFIDRLE